MGVYDFVFISFKRLLNKGWSSLECAPVCALLKTKSSETVDFIGVSELFLRSVADLNCCTRFCRPLPNRSANRPCCDFALQR